MVIWLIGMSGAGKSTIGRELYKRLKSNNPATVLVDGDEIRRIFRHDRNNKAYGIDERLKNAERIRELCAWLDKQSIDVVCCILSLFEESHIWNREHYTSYFEVYISASMETLESRDSKGLYTKAKQALKENNPANMVGVDIPFNPPKSPDLVLDNSDTAVTPSEQADKIITALCERNAS